MSGTTADRRIRELRPPKPMVDPWSAHGIQRDRERRPGGGTEEALTVFLAGSECPFTCSFCDLWRWTIDGPTPPGALSEQLARALAAQTLPADRIKLYNASNFFDARAVPLEDWPGLAKLVSPFRGVTVESHASTVGPRVRDFADRIAGRLEVAIGLETVHPVAIQHLNKRLDLGRFARACEYLDGEQVDLRVFVLLGAPYVPVAESVEWVCRTVELAVARGASVVSIIPVRGGNGELERIQALGHFTPPTLGQLEEALDRCLGFSPTVVTADLWDTDRLAAGEPNAAARVERLRRINLSGHPEPRIP